MGSTLIIHPKDDSTTFLDVIYKNMKDITLITGGVSKSDVVQLIIEHDRVMMMGHGSTGGLFTMGQFITYAPYIIDYTIAPYLKQKHNNVFIWCNADKFVNFHDLEGFFSGMFISEVSEATYCGLPGMSQDIVDESNFGFCELVSKYINDDKFKIYENVKKEYGLIAENNPIALYNHKRLYAV